MGMTAVADCLRHQAIDAVEIISYSQGFTNKLVVKMGPNEHYLYPGMSFLDDINKQIESEGRASLIGMEVYLVTEETRTGRYWRMSIRKKALDQS